MESVSSRRVYIYAVSADKRENPPSGVARNEISLNQCRGCAKGLFFPAGRSQIIMKLNYTRGQVDMLAVQIFSGRDGREAMLLVN